MAVQPDPRKPIVFKVQFEHCPVQASLGVLGRKWAFLVLRDIAVFRAQRYNQMLRVTPGMTRRTLSMRLNELERAGFIVRAESDHKYTRWEATEKGRDVLPVLMTLVQFGAKWHATEVFADQRSRTLDEIFEPAFVRQTMVPRRSTRASARVAPESPPSAVETTQLAPAPAA